MIPDLKRRFNPFFSKENRGRDIKVHLTIWSIFIFYEVSIVGLVRGSFGTPANYILHYGLNILLFYLHAEFVLNYSLNSKRGKTFKVTFLVALELAFYVAVVLIMDLNLSKYTTVLGYQRISVDEQLLLGYIWRGLYFMLFSTGYYFLKKYIQERNEKENINRYRLEELIVSEKTEKELALAKNAFLLAQVNPHFLFNTLNFIYYKTYKGSPDGAKAILRLSKIMYYATKALASSEQVIISEEVEHIENIIAINKMRHGEKLIIDLQYDSDILNLKIIPLVLITIVENIFKHGYLTQSEFRAYFSITSDEKNLIISSGNLSKNSKNLTGLNSGLKNIKERMKYTYGAEAKIKYSENAQNYFTLELHIPLILCR